MTGRNLFKKFNKIIMILQKLFNLAPTFIVQFFYNLTSNSEGKVSLLYRYLYLKRFAKSCGENVFIGKNVVLKNINNLSLGNNVSIHALSYIDAAGGITISNNVSIANLSSIISFEHTWSENSIPIKYNKVIFKEIYIEDDVWIGSNVKVLGGVKINSRSIVAAGAVVNKNVESNYIVGGVPAKKIKHLEMD